MHRRVEITCEREVLSVLHDPALSITGLCVQCGRDVVKFTPELAAATSGYTPREIYRWLEEQKLHFDELTTGQVFVCSESLKTLHQI
jgi:predicted flavoprotein YhiN